MSINFESLRSHLRQFDFGTLFTEDLGWSLPRAPKPVPMAHGEQTFRRRELAELAGVRVFEVDSDTGGIPDAKARAELHKQVASISHENLVIFVDAQRSQSLWRWIKRDGGKALVRDHYFAAGQPGDLFISKLSSIVFDITDFDERGNVSIVEVARRLRHALDVERVTKKFFGEFQDLHLRLVEQIRGIENAHDRRWYASVLLHRLMFIYFLQKKGFLDGRRYDYLNEELAKSRAKGADLFYPDFLALLFFEGFAKPEERRSDEAKRRLGHIRYLNGGLFLKHAIELRHPEIAVPDAAFEDLLGLFGRYSWTLNDAPDKPDNEINPDVLGYIFEKYINQKDFGAYYTRPEITEYLCAQTIHRVILDRVHAQDPAGRRWDSVQDLLLDLDATLCRRLILDRGILDDLTILDPACGSGAFLVAAMKTLINIYSAVIGRIEFLNDPDLTRWLKGIRASHPSVAYFIKKKIITRNLFGVDLMEEGSEIAKLRLFLALVSSAEREDQLEPLPNIDFNILAGNSLIGVLHVDDASFNRRLPQLDILKRNRTYREIVSEAQRLIENYRSLDSYAENLVTQREAIEQVIAGANRTLNELLLDEMKGLDIRYEDHVWDVKKRAEGKPRRRPLATADVEVLHPFHWGFRFDSVLGDRGGFDVIIMNPPWDAFKPDAKEFFEDYSDLVSKKKMTIKEFEKEQAKLLEDDGGLREAWEAYLSRFPHVAAWFRAAPQFEHQSSVVGGKKVGTDTNLYKLFVEQCFNLLADGGQAGIVVPAGLYNDQGAKALRELLFDHGTVRAILGLSNEKFLFEAVDHRVKFCVLVFTKGGTTTAFEAAFRINPREAVDADHLEDFLRDAAEHVALTPNLVRALSPSTLSIMEFHGQIDIDIAQKMMRFPVLEANASEGRRLVLCNEFHMTNDSDLFKSQKAAGRLPLCEGKMIHQFVHGVIGAKYWINERDGRKRILGNGEDHGQTLDYQRHRLAFRDVARNTDERTMICTVLPRDVFCPHTVSLEKVGTLDMWARLYLVALFNSFCIDYLLRQRVNAHVSFFFVYNLPVPPLQATDPKLRSIALRAAKLIWTDSEFDDLAAEVGLRGSRGRSDDMAGRRALRSEIDGLVAHLYGLSEEEFVHILSTFPVVPDPDKVAAHNAYRDVRNGLVS